VVLGRGQSTASLLDAARLGRSLQPSPGTPVAEVGLMRGIVGAAAGGYDLAVLMRRLRWGGQRSERHTAYKSAARLPAIFPIDPYAGDDIWPCRAVLAQALGVLPWPRPRAQDGAKATIPTSPPASSLGLPGCPLDGPAAGTGPRADQAGSGPSVPRQSVGPGRLRTTSATPRTRSSGRGPPSRSGLE